MNTEERDIEMGQAATSNMHTNAMYQGSPRVAETPIRNPDHVAIDIPDTVIPQETTKMSKGQERMAKKILESLYPNEPEMVKDELERYAKDFDTIDRNITDDIEGPEAFNIDLEVPKLISEPQLKDFFKRVLDKYSAFSKASIENGYKEKPKEWFESRANRARLVLVEATEQNLPEIAKAVLNASPLERVVAVGLDAEMQSRLKEELITAWEQNVNEQSSPGAYQQKVLQALNDETGQTVNRFEDASLNQLMGPHDYSAKTDITFENMRNELDKNFYSKIDEIILYGNTPQLAQELPQLAKNSEAIQSLAIKAAPFNEADNSLFWTAALDGVAEPLAHLTTAKNPGQILETGKFKMNPDFEKIFNERVEEEGLNARDAKFLKEMLTSKSLYMNNLSPQLYATTITKAQSGLNGKGAIVVGDALPWGIMGRIVATAYGARFAVNSTMIDTANDMHQEDQEKMLGYRGMYNTLLVDSINKSPEEPVQNVVKELVKGFAAIEKDPEIIRQDKQGASERVFSLMHANNTNNKNERGIKLITPQPLNFFYGVAATSVGLGLSITAVGASIAFPIVGASVFAASTGLLAASLLTQKSANSTHMSRWHRASARARGTFKNAQDKRDKLVMDRTTEIIGQRSGPSQDQTMQQDLYQEQSRESRVEANVQPSVPLNEGVRNERMPTSPSESNSIMESTSDDRSELLVGLRVPSNSGMAQRSNRSPGASTKSSIPTQMKP
ncbi:hypothetical protein FGM00_11385 [Aggregatimonas sangjinii]|uniref:Uncharacterized protein n=1 Tax=Aggregatimonas sangjinii TaxID=2583587 RepID=A0A5B7SV21_9FLAO|nr:hypothetical protein [Aggregatimonas sangjinii]QCX00680.1 hypothetical protein FGM00_11385 [Aggregatimonas sangjinii]